MNPKFLKVVRSCSTISFVLLGILPVHAKPLNAKDYFETAPQLALVEAAGRGQVDKLKRLLVEGADINLQGREGMTALIFAFVSQNKHAFQALLELGANPNVQMKNGDSAMSYAAMHENIWYLEAVLKHGGNPDLVDPATGETPIYESIHRLRQEHVRVLIAAHANLNYQNKIGDTPVMAAAALNQYDMVYAMLEAGADSSLRDKYGNSVLYFIRHNRINPKADGYKWRTRVIEFLKTKGIDVENGK